LCKKLKIKVKILRDFFASAYALAFLILKFINRKGIVFIGGAETQSNVRALIGAVGQKPHGLFIF